MNRRFTTLSLTTLLHAFTHAYGVLLVPLYLMMRDDLHLSGVKPVAFIVALYGVIYFLLSYPAGMLADRYNRKVLLGIGLLGNAAAILLMGFTRQYWMLVLLGVLAGIFGSLFHPSANALVPAHFPRSPGLPLGVLGIGAGIGFFVGSQYSGWRAQTAGEPWLGLAPWQVPCIEMGLVGLGAGLLYLLLAREVAHTSADAQRLRTPLGPGMRRRVLSIAMVLGCRDFAGVATPSLLSIYLQKAHGFDVQRTGWIVGAIGLISIVATPLGVWLTSGRRRLPGLATVVIMAGLILAAVPHIPLAWLMPVLCVYQVFHLSSYAISEVSLVERVGSAQRGRVVGLYLTLAGTAGSLSPWVVGWWTDRLGGRALEPQGYSILFAVMGGMMIFASMSVRLIAHLGRPHALHGVDAALPVTADAPVLPA